MFWYWDTWIFNISWTFTTFFYRTMPLFASITLLILIFEFKFMELLGLHLKEIFILVTSFLYFPMIY